MLAVNSKMNDTLEEIGQLLPFVDPLACFLDHVQNFLAVRFFLSYSGLVIRTNTAVCRCARYSLYRAALLLVCCFRVKISCVIIEQSGFII
jgi:hypothetical protein